MSISTFDKLLQAVGQYLQYEYTTFRKAISPEGRLSVTLRSTNTMSEEPEYQLRRRRLSGNPNLPINLDVSYGYQVSEGGPSRGTPSPSGVMFIPNTKDPHPSAALLEFRKKQQSFDIQVEECEEEVIIFSDDEPDTDEAGAAAVAIQRPVTPTPIQDYAANVTYLEGPQASDFLQVKMMEQDCVTDISDAETEEDE